MNATDLRHLEAARKLRAERKTGTLARRQADRGRQEVKDGEDDRGDRGDDDNLLNVRGLAGDDGHCHRNGETLQEILNGAREKFRGRETVHCLIFGGLIFFSGARYNLKIELLEKGRTTMSGEEEKKEVYLEADKEIPGQHYVALSFLSPNKVLKNKDIYFFSEFLKDYEIQYKIRATESFVMKQATKVQEAASRVQDVLENLQLRKEGFTAEDLSGALATVKEMRAGLTRGNAEDLEAHVKSEMADFKTSAINEAYETFLFKHKKRLDEQFFADNAFRTTVQGLKVRGVYDTYAEALGRAKTLQKIDPSFNVYVGQVGFWLPWDPEPQEVQDQEYADEQLNTLMKKYKENESQRDEYYAQTKKDRLGAGKVRDGAPVVSSAGASTAPSDMFAGEDLALARKKERAAATEKNVVLP